MELIAVRIPTRVLPHLIHYPNHPGANGARHPITT